jgi:lysozyme family protein
MADFDVAFEYLMGWEDDHQHPGRITSDEGGRTRFGIAENWHHDLTALGFFDEMPYEEAFMLAKQTYRENEWHQMQGDRLSSQALANKWLSLGVNLGMGRVVRWAQEAAGATPDGFVGPNTLRAINGASSRVFQSISTDAEAQYRQDAEKQPGDLKGWLRRSGDSAEVTVNA